MCTRIETLFFFLLIIYLYSISNEFIFFWLKLSDFFFYFLFVILVCVCVSLSLSIEILHLTQSFDLFSFNFCCMVAQFQINWCLLLLLLLAFLSFFFKNNLLFFVFRGSFFRLILFFYFSTIEFTCLELAFFSFVFLSDFSLIMMETCFSLRCRRNLILLFLFKELRVSIRLTWPSTSIF